MQIILSIISNDAKREMINGFDVAVVDAPALVGSPKQIAWADKIRDEAIRDFVKVSGIEKARWADRWLKTESFATPEAEAAVATINAGCVKLAAALAAKTSAKAWIDAIDGGTSRPSLLTIQKIIKG